MTRTGVRRSAPPTHRADALAALLLALTTVVYLTALPHNLGAVDESNFIYQSKRLADGEVMYRDIFDLITPLSMYLTALAFALFGADMGVARATIAVVHATIVVAIFAACRLLQVRWSLAAAAAAAHLAIAQPAWGYVSQHWFATAATMLVLCSLLRGRWEADARQAFVPGVLTGVLIGIQQQKGVPIVAGVALALCAAHWATHPRPPRRALAARLAAFAVGIAAVAIPLFAFLLARAGIEPLVHSLIVFPVVNYRQAYRSSWGGVQAFTAYYASFTFPTLLAWAPLSAAPSLLRLAIAWRRGRPRADDRAQITLLVFALATLASIAYYPDVIHLAFIAPVFLILAAEAVDRMLAVLGRPAAAVAAVIAAGIVAATAWQLRAIWQRLWSEFSVPYDTAFGRMDFADRGFIPVIDRARELLAVAPINEIFCYPSISGPYLWTGARNPTRYQYYSPTYNDRAQTREIIARLQARRTPLILTSPLMTRKDDPIIQYMQQHYEIVRFGYVPKIFLYRRTDVFEPGL